MAHESENIPSLDVGMYVDAFNNSSSLPASSDQYLVTLPRKYGGVEKSSKTCLILTLAYGIPLSG